jgi:hypothetical protein
MDHGSSRGTGSRAVGPTSVVTCSTSSNNNQDQVVYIVDRIYVLLATTTVSRSTIRFVSSNPTHVSTIVASDQ